MTGCPASASVVPLSVWPASCSALLITSSPATVSKVSTGAVVSTIRSCVWLMLLPALSLTVAETVRLPSVRDARSAAGTVSIHRGGVVFAIERDGHGLTGFGAGVAFHRQVLSALGGIQHIVTGQRVDAERRGNAIHVNIMTGRRTVTGAVMRTGSDS